MTPDKKFWEEFWRDVKIPAIVDMSFPNDRVIAHAISRHLSFDSSKTALEAGCAPGKWMIFLNKKFGFRVDGVDYLEGAVNTTRKNLEMNGVTNSNVYEGDFMGIEIDRRYDMILALGFLEHFDDPDRVMERFLGLLKRGGRLIVGVPNFRGINYVFAKFFDRRKDLLANHNLDVMRLDFFNEESLKYKLRIDYCDYLGGFEPELFDISGHSFCPRAILSIIFRCLKAISWNRVLKNLFSGYILTVYSKEE